MKKLLLSVTFFASFATFTQAQVVNGEFEAWTQGGTSPNTYNDPDGWSTLNSQTAVLGLFTCEKETSNVHGGSSAAKLTTRFIGFPINQLAPCIITNGTINVSSQMAEGGQAFTERPTAFTGWYIASPENGDQYSFGALLINENTGDTVGSADFVSTTTVSSYTMFTADVTYTSQDNPTILQIILLSSDPFNAAENSTVTFDDLDYTITSNVDELDVELIKTYPNPVVDYVHFSLGKHSQAKVVFYNVLGAQVKEAVITNDKNFVDLSQLAGGTYIWKFMNEKKQVVKTGKLVK